MAYIAATLNPEILKKIPGPFRVGKKKSGSGRVAATRQGLSVTSQTGSKRPSEPICQRHWTHFHCLKPLSCTYSMLSIAPLKWVTTKGKSFLFVEKARQWYWYRLPCLFSLLNVFNGNQKLIWESCYIVYFGCGQASVTTNHMVWILVDGNRTQNNDKNYEKNKTHLK